MKANVLTFINELESYKTAIKTLHWTSSNMSEHKFFDDVADAVSNIQDTVAEIEQGMHGRIGKRELKPKKYTVRTSKKFLNDLLASTQKFLKTLTGKEYAGMKSEVETFLGEVNKFFYLLDLCLKEDVARRLKGKLNESKTNNIMKQKIRLTESQLHKVIKESVKKILSEDRKSDLERR